MTPADQLRAAAERLRDLREALPTEHWGDRPWQAEECSRTDDAPPSPCPCIVSQGEYRDFDQPQDPPIQYIADAETPEFAAYIATMHPGVGKALAAWLESAARDAREIGPDPHALTIARAVLGTPDRQP
ncbi:hypothetical protein QA802_07750 [Streptomyces sp. B21-105]|uniref:hypothetical protein n=1 Tax=Streptomyces sp. B21-105 TaxID=3039417 RepID=UPI002FF219FD